MERNSEHEAADDTTPADSGSKVVPGGDDKTDNAEPGREASGGVSNGSKAPEKLVQEEDPNEGSDRSETPPQQLGNMAKDADKVEDG